jgi:hypothetical protein
MAGLQDGRIWAALRDHDRSSLRPFFFSRSG